MSKQIVVVAGGFVFMGDRQESNDSWVVLHDAAVIRKWGTTRGLGEIALSGPTPETVLDPCGVTALPINSVYAVIDCTYQ